MAKKQADKSALKKFKRDIESGELKPLYLLYGPEKYLLNHYRRKLLKTALGSEEDVFNFKRYEGSALSMDELQDAVWTLPFGAPKTVIEVRDLDILKDAKWRQFFETFLLDLPPHVCLIFSYNTLDFKPDARAKLMKVINGAGLIVEFFEQERNDLSLWIMRRFHANGKELKREDAEYMIFRCGALMEGLSMEADKLASYAEREIITREDIDAVTIPVLEAVVFELCDQVVDGKTAEAVKTLGTLFAMKNEAYSLLAVISKQFRQIYELKVSANEGAVSESFAMELLGIRSPYAIRRILAASKKLDAGFLGRAILKLAETDFLIKSTDIDRERELTLLLVWLSERRGG